jgi:hypothetical protein
MGKARSERSSSSRLQRAECTSSSRVALHSLARSCKSSPHLLTFTFLLRSSPVIRFLDLLEEEQEPPPQQVHPCGLTLPRKRSSGLLLLFEGKPAFHCDDANRTDARCGHPHASGQGHHEETDQVAQPANREGESRGAREHEQRRRGAPCAQARARSHRRTRGGLPQGSV